SARSGHGAHAPPGEWMPPRGRLRNARTCTRHDVVRGATMATRRRRRWGALAAVVALVLGEGPLGAQGEPSVAQVGISGNLRVEEDAIRVHLRSQPGQPFDQDLIDRDIRSIYAMGFFDQVDADVTKVGENRVDVVFRVKERPLVRTVKVEGTDKVKREELEGALKI